MRQKLLFLAGCLIVFAMLLTACGSGPASQKPSVNTTSASRPDELENQLYIRVKAETQAIVFALNDSSAAESLYAQLPLILPVENHSTNEKICYPPEELDISDAPLAKGLAGLLTYYAPWGNVAVFYGECMGASGLYELGRAVSGIELIAELTGVIRIEAVTDELPEGPSGAGSGNPPAGRAAKSNESHTTSAQQEGRNMRNIEMIIGNQRFSAALYDNAAAEAFSARLPLTLEMSELNGNEKYAYLDGSLPANPKNPGGIRAGELMLYGNNCLVLFYESFSTSYSYTPLGRLNESDSLAKALGSGSASVTIQIRPAGYAFD